VWFEKLSEARLGDLFLKGKRRVPLKGITTEEGETLLPFMLPPAFQRLLFLDEVGRRDRVGSEREVLDCYMTSLFNAWLDNQNLRGVEKRWVVAFSPRRAWGDGLDRFESIYPDGRLISIDAKTGVPDGGFGAGGTVDMHEGVAEKYRNREYGMTSPPAVYKNVIICGSLTADGTPQGPLGDVRGYDARTGKLLWTFHVVPRPGEFGHETWEGDSWKERGAINAWSILTVDTERGIVFLPLTSPSTSGAPASYGCASNGIALRLTAYIPLVASSIGRPSRNRRRRRSAKWPSRRAAVGL